MAVLQPTRGPIKYVAELFRIDDFNPRSAIADSVFDRKYNIYAFSVAPNITDPDNYWIQWGGYFDNYTGYGIQLFFGQFLTEVFLTSSLQSTENSFYVDTVNSLVYINITYKPFQYSSAFSALYDNSNSTFSTAPRDPENLSDIYYGNVRAYPRMETPSIKNKLNDVISGIVVYNDFSIDIDNHDGLFDGLDITEYFNTPVQVSKVVGEATTLAEFNRIRYGTVQDIKVTFDALEIKGVDQIYLMNKSFCRKADIALYPNISDTNLNKEIPVAWGPVLGVELIEVNRDTADPATWAEYIALDSDYITSVQAVYDDDGNEFTLTTDYTFDTSTGIIKIIKVDGDGEVIDAETADVTGQASCKLGQVVIDALSRNENLAYVEGIWDITETNKYLAICPDVGFYFDGGTTRELVQGVLKNDIAFLIQKNNGLLTIRRWGETYDTHTIQTYLTTQKPEKDFEDASKYYCSTAKIMSGKNHASGNYTAIYIDDTREDEIFENYRRSYTAEFETDLTDDGDIEDLAERVLERFGEVRETLSVGVGSDTFQINLLDTVKYEAWINEDRAFSEYSEWIVKECDPGQDIITMEGTKITYLLSFDGDYAMIQNSLFEVL
jgi:hypothetical protein